MKKKQGLPTKKPRMGTWGAGHGAKSNLPPIKPSDTDRLDTMKAAGLIQPTTKAYTMGACLIFVSPPVNDAWAWHMSISSKNRYPLWDEIAKARYELLPGDITFVMVLPPVGEYVNIHDNCFQLWEEGKRRS